MAAETPARPVGRGSRIRTGAVCQGPRLANLGSRPGCARFRCLLVDRRWREGTCHTARDPDIRAMPYWCSGGWRAIRARDSSLRPSHLSPKGGRPPGVESSRSSRNALSVARSATTLLSRQACPAGPGDGDLAMLEAGLDRRPRSRAGRHCDELRRPCTPWRLTERSRVIPP